MSERTLERQQVIEYPLADEQKALHEIQLLREQQEMEGLHDRVLQFEESGGIRIVSYNDYEKETLTRDLDGNERVILEEITMDDKTELDSMFDIMQEYEQEEMTMDDVGSPDTEFEQEKEMDDAFERDEIDRDDDMEYDC